MGVDPDAQAEGFRFDLVVVAFAGVEVGAVKGVEGQVKALGDGQEGVKQVLPELLDRLVEGDAVVDGEDGLFGKSVGLDAAVDDVGGLGGEHERPPDGPLVDDVLGEVAAAAGAAGGGLDDELARFLIHAGVIDKAVKPLHERVGGLEVGGVGVVFELGDEGGHDADAGVRGRGAGVAALGFDGDLSVEVAFFRHAGEGVGSVAGGEGGDAHAAFVDDELDAVAAVALKDVLGERAAAFGFGLHELFVEAKGEQDGALGREAGLQQGGGAFQEGGERRLVVEGASAPDEAAVKVAGVRRVVPVSFVADGDGVVVGHVAGGLELGVGPRPGEEVAISVHHLELQVLKHKRELLSEGCVEVGQVAVSLGVVLHRALVVVGLSLDLDELLPMGEGLVGVGVCVEVGVHAVQVCVRCGRHKVLSQTLGCFLGEGVEWVVVLIEGGSV